MGFYIKGGIIITGSLQIKRKKYFAIINIKDRFGKSKPKWVDTGILVTGNNKKKAEKKLREILCEYENKNIIFTKSIDFAEYISNWLELIKHTIEQTTFESYHQYVHKHIIPYFTAHKAILDKLSKQHLQMYYNFQFEHGRIDGKGGLSAKTLKNQHAIIGKALKDAMMDDLIVYNPNDRVKLPKKKPFIGKYYSVEQANQLIKASKDTDLYVAVILAVFCGLRRSELLGLKWASVSFEQKAVTIKDTVVRIKTIIEKERTKNKSSYRTMRLTDEITNILKSEKEKQCKNKLLFGYSYHDNDYIIKHADGTVYLPNSFTKIFQRIMKKANLPVIRLHDIRHTTASILINHGFNLKEVQEWLGHSDIGTTANIYGHLDSQSKNNIANGFGQLLTM